MNARIPDITDDQRLWDMADSNQADYEQRVEGHTDYMLDQCKSLAYCEGLNSDYELGYGMLLPQMMQTVASWNGRSDTANDAMKALYVLMANAIGKVALSEVKE